MEPASLNPDNTAPGAMIGATGTVAGVGIKQRDVNIDPARIVVVSILSFGLYFFYWFYLTWKHYRDYTKTENFPIWHALALFVPIYSLFRVHAHIRSFKELMDAAGMNSGLSPGLFVVLVIIMNILSGISQALLYNGPSPSVFVLVLVFITLGIVMLLWVQTNLNQYWRTIKDIYVTNARIGVGEVIFILIGILAWIGTFLPET